MGRLAWAPAAFLAVGLGLGGSAPSAEQDQARLPGETFRDCADCIELVVVPLGEFDMGSNAKPMEQPVHHVVIRKNFAIARREVTFSDWDRCALQPESIRPTPAITIS